MPSLHRIGVRLEQVALVSRLHAANVLSRRPAVDPAGEVVVSLTTTPRRLPLVHLAIECIARGTLRPRRLVLWLGDEATAAAPGPALERLRARGVEVRYAQDVGPHTKYYPALALCRPGTALVTADDDILYDRAWLRDLVTAHHRHPDDVIAHRAHRVALEDGTIAPYNAWPPCDDTDASILHFATGVSGVLYPAHMVTALADAGTAFLGCTPKNDDVWLHYVAARTGTGVRQVRSSPRHYPSTPATFRSRLSASNVDDGGNDRQIAATYDRTCVERLVRAGGEAAEVAR